MKETIKNIKIVYQYGKQYKKNLIEMYNIKELIMNNDLIEEDDNIYINYDKIYVENSILINFVGE